MQNIAKGVEKISRLVEAMQARLPIEYPRSLCELRLSQRDYDDLCLWAKERLTRSAVVISGWKVGAIIFNLIAEAARREAVGHRLWPIVAEKFSDEIRQYLFPNNHPSDDLKRWIQKAAKQLGLRHVFDDNEAQAWYITTHLQFGFAAHSFKSQLPEWLCGQSTPDSVRRLLDGNLSSDSFRDLWQALRFYRRDWITEEEVREVIEKSPWVLPEWKDDLVRLAREKLHLVDVEEGSESEEVSSPDLIQNLRIEWAFDSEPSFTCTLADLQPLELTHSHYHLVFGNETVLSLFRQGDGGYRADREGIELRASAPQIPLRLTNPEGEVEVLQLVSLWDSSADISIFDLSSGEHVDADSTRMSESKSYILIMHSDLCLDPKPRTWARLAGGSQRIAVLLEKPWSHLTTHVSMSDGTLLWRPQYLGTLPGKDEPAELQRLSVQIADRNSTVALGDSVTAIIRGLPPDFEVCYVRYCGRPMTFDHKTNRIEKFTIHSSDVNSGMPFRIGIRPKGIYRNEVFHLRRTLDVGVSGTAWATVSGWEPIDSRSIITSRACRENSFRVHLLNESDDAKVALMEGPRLLKWLGRRAAPFGRVHGIGAPLVIRRQPYNSGPELLTIARGCSNGGIIEGLDFEPDEAKTIRIKLTRPIELSNDHFVIAWPWGNNNEPIWFDSHNVVTSDDRRTWRVKSSSYGIGKKVIVAVGFKGKWRGSATAGDTVDMLYSLVEFSQNKYLVSSLVRWFQLPVLLSDSREGYPAFADFAHSYPDAVMAAWLNDGGLPHTLKHDEGFDRRQVESIQLRELYLEWQPTFEQVLQIVQLLSENDQDPLGDVAAKLILELPLVTGHIMKQWLAAYGTPQKVPLKFYLSCVRAYLGQKVSKGNDTQSKHHSEQLDRVAKNMNVGPNTSADEFFVKNAIVDPAVKTLSGHVLSRVEKRNLSVAMQLAPFRQYLASRVLNELEQG